MALVNNLLSRTGTGGTKLQASPHKHWDSGFGERLHSHRDKIEEDVVTGGDV